MARNKREYDRAYYLANRDRRKGQIRERNKVAIERNKNGILDYLEGKSCMDCGFSDPRALQFDHRDPTTKRLAVADMMRSAYSWEALLEEMNKCDIVCANCHSIRTCETYGFYKSLASLAQFGRAPVL